MKLLSSHLLQYTGELRKIHKLGYAAVRKSDERRS